MSGALQDLPLCNHIPPAPDKDLTFPPSSPAAVMGKPLLNEVIGQTAGIHAMLKAQVVPFPQTLQCRYRL